MTKYAFGWVRQKPDERDWKLQVPRRILVSLPPTVDLSASLGPQLDQGSLGSCGPNTADECIEFDQHAQGLPVASASRLFIYWVTRYLMGTVNFDSGVDNRTLLKALAGYGFCPESMWPYDVSRFTQQPPQACFQAAQANRISNYAAVAQDLLQMQGCLASGFPFIFGFSVYHQMESDTCAQNGIVADPQPGDSAIGGHDVTICGYTTVQRPGVLPGNIWPANTFKFRNHWMNDPQTPWGDGGYGYISFNYATAPKLAGDFWVINAIPGGMPNPPKPPPSPSPSPSPSPQPPTPTPTPTPGPDVNPIQQMIDGLFAQLEAAVQASSAGMLAKLFLLSALKQLNQAVDSLFTANPQYHAAERSFPLTPDQIKELADVVLGIAEKVFAGKPAVAAIIAAIKLALDSFLSTQAAPLLSWKCA